MATAPDLSAESGDAATAHAALDRRIMRGSAWLAVSYGGRQVVTLVSSVVLARLLDPKAFGLVALAFIALSVLQELQDSGLGASLVHRREGIEDAAGTVFVFSAITGAALYACAFFAAPLVGKAFHSGPLPNVLRVLALMLLIRSLTTVPSALLERALNYRPRTVSDIAAATVQAAGSISLAALGAGVWALVIGQLAGSAVSGAILWRYVPFRPDPRRASIRTARSLLRYGRFITGGNLLLIASMSIDNITVGRLLSATALGFYSVAFRVTELPVVVIGPIVGRVMFPVYSMVREDVATVRRAYLMNLQRVALLSLPVSIGMVAGARPLVRVLLGDRWLPSVSALQVLAVFAVVRALIAPSGELFKGMGKPQYNMITGSLYLPIALPLLWVLIDARGILGAALAVLITLSLIGLLTTWLVLRLLELSVVELLWALTPFLVVTGIVGGSIEVAVRFTDQLAPAASLSAAIVAGALALAVSTTLFARRIVADMWISLRRHPVESAAV